MFKKSISIILCLAFVMSFIPSGALAQTITGTETGSNVSQNLPISNMMESTTSVTSEGNSLISLALSRDRVEGNYSVKVWSWDVANQNIASYKLVDSSAFDASTYSRVKVWIKPGPGAKWVKFLTDNGTNDSYITSDKNADGFFKVGEDIKSGKWNLITLDLTKATPSLTDGDGLTVYTNEKSTWYYDNISSVYAPTSSIDITNMENSQTAIASGTNELRFKLNGSAYEATPTVLVSQKGSDFTKTDNSQADFQQGTLTDLCATSDGDLELASGSQVLFYDDFTNSIDTSKWNIVSGNVTTDGTNLVVGDSQNDWDYVTYNGSFSMPSPGNTLTFEAVGILGRNVLWDQPFGFWNKFCFYGLGSTTNVLTNDNRVSLGADYSSSQHVWKIEVTSSDAKYYVDNSLKATIAHSSTSVGGLIFHSHDANSYTIVDWVKVSETTNDSKYITSGNRVSPVIDISSVDSAATSTIEWNATTPTNTTANVQTKLFVNGAWQNEWQTATNGGSIPGISAGTNLTGAKLQYKVNLSTTDPLYTPQLNDITINVNGNDIINLDDDFPNGKISGISVNSSYANTSEQAAALLAKRLYLSGVKPTKIAVSGDGKMVYYNNPAVSNKLYLLNLNNGQNRKLSDFVPALTKVNGNGSKAAFKDSGNNLYIYDSISDKTTSISTAVGDFKIQKDGTIYYTSAGSSIICQYNPNISASNKVIVNGQSVAYLDVAREADKLYYSNTNQLTSVTLTPAGWKPSLETSTTANIEGIWANPDGSSVFLKSNGSFYSYQTSTKSLRKLDIKASCIIKVTDDNKLVVQDANYKYQLYNPDNDGLKNIRPSDAKNPASDSDVLFDVDNTGNKMIYVATTGISGYYINGAQKPERYLFSFDGENSWYSYQDGTWTVVRSGSVPVEDDFIKSGMTVDEVNNLKENDFSSLYEDGVEILHFDAAVYFASTDPYTTPSLKGINAIFNASESDDAPIEKALYVKKQQDFNASNWRKLKKIVATELYPKDAETYYFISDGGEPNTFKDNAWSEVSSQWFTSTSTVEANWINITQKGMTASELRAIPEASLNEALPSNTISVVYVTQIKDLSSEKYVTRITCEYTEKLFTTGTTYTLKVTLNSGTSGEKSYTGQTNAQVEDFMEWYNERQYDRGPVAYKITIPGPPKKTEFINYYMIQSISVEEN